MSTEGQGLSPFTQTFTNGKCIVELDYLLNPPYCLSICPIVPLIIQFYQHLGSGSQVISLQNLSSHSTTHPSSQHIVKHDVLQVHVPCFRKHCLYCDCSTYTTIRSRQGQQRRTSRP